MDIVLCGKDEVGRESVVDREDELQRCARVCEARPPRRGLGRRGECGDDLRLAKRAVRYVLLDRGGGAVVWWTVTCLEGRGGGSLCAFSSWRSERSLFRGVCEEPLCPTSKERAGTARTRERGGEREREREREGVPPLTHTFTAPSARDPDRAARAALYARPRAWWRASACRSRGSQTKTNHTRGPVPPTTAQILNSMMMQDPALSSTTAPSWDAAQPALSPEKSA